MVRRTDQEAQRIAGQKMGYAECGRDPDRQQQKNGNDHLGQIEANLHKSGIDIAATEAPPPGS
jgi:hypothetical protein